MNSAIFAKFDWGSRLGKIQVPLTPIRRKTKPKCAHFGILLKLFKKKRLTSVADGNF